MFTEKKITYLFRGALFLALVSVFILTLMRTAYLPSVSANDKLVHLLAFSGLAFLADFSYHAGKLMFTKTLMLLFFGIAIEVAQYFTSWRTADWQDVVADLLGILIYWLIAPLIIKFAFWQKNKSLQ